MPDLNKIVSYTNKLLRLHDYPDFGAMGLQWKGNPTVRGIASTVSIDCDVIERANAAGCNLILAHHGLFWNNESRLWDDRGRIELLKRYKISVLGYHLCLDAHSKYGNNSLAARLLGLQKLHVWEDIGYTGEYKVARTQDNFFTYAVEKFMDYQPPIGEPIEYYPFGNKSIKSVAVITGGAPQYIVQAHRDGYDAFVTGEFAEPTYYIAKDLGMNFLALGHFRTETLGPRKLGQHLAREFKIPHKFLSF